MRIPLGVGTFKRVDQQMPIIPLKNRFFEINPTNQESQIALLARPFLKKWLSMGSGPIRAVYSQPGSFDDALFIISGEALYRIDVDETVTLISSSISTTDPTAFISMAATPDYLFIADGRALLIYTDNGFAHGTLTASGAIANNDTVQIGDIYYKWTNAGVDVGTPDGGVANPWLVALGLDAEASLLNLAQAITAQGVPGTTYSSDLDPHPDATVETTSASTLRVRALEPGALGNGIVTAETGANIAWGGGFFTGGGASGITQVPTPDAVGVVSVGFIAGFVICVIAQGFGMNGRFYWIEPGDTIIDPLNFATAERSPDPLWNVTVVGDQFWLLGTNTTEVWYPTGDPAAPFLRTQGRLFERGVWEGTAIQVKDAVILTDTDGVVYSIAGSPVRISNHAVEERIRKAMIEQRITEED